MNNNLSFISNIKSISVEAVGQCVIVFFSILRCDVQIQLFLLFSFLNSRFYEVSEISKEID